MDELSSLDSFHGDEDVDAGASSAEKTENKTSLFDDLKADKDNNTANKGEEETGKDADASNNDNDEEFEQISEGTFDVDDNSQTQDDEVAAGDATVADVEVDAAKDEEEKAAPTVVGTAGGDADESANFEEVDASVSSINASANEEADMLGESDMTLPADKNKSGEMEVDNDDSAAAAAGDVEMASVSNSPEPKEDENAVRETQHDESMEETNEEAHANAEDELEEKDVVDGEEFIAEDAEHKITTGENSPEEFLDNSVDALEHKDVEEAAKDEEDDKQAEEAKETVDEREEREEREAEEEKEADEAENQAEEEKEAEQEAIEKETVAEQEQEINEHEEVEAEAEAEDEPVENVQEPEESDVCLIPDDTETQMTDAEKEQAILARENAEKEDEEKEKEQQQQQANAAEQEKLPEDEQSSAQQAAEKSADVDEDGNVNIAADDIAATDVDASLLQEMSTRSGHGAAADAAVSSKIIIAWIVTTEKPCKQCGEVKNCGFRYKNAESNEFDYICEQSCCEALLAEQPGKYFIRRKKFLVEELVNESDADAAAAEGAEAAKAANVCLQCKESKPCKYFFKQDEDAYYICNDVCFNLLNVEEPDKFKLKRHSIRVRNIGATLTTQGGKSGEAGSSAESRVVARTTAEAEAARLERVASFTRRCVECFAEIKLGDKNLLWETMDFCNEICLGKYQRKIGSSCQTCQGEVSQQALGKYCVRFGFDIRQFCCAVCLNEFKKGLKTCSCCQKDISGVNEGFLAPVGDKEQFKDFCSQVCLRRYDTMCNPKKKQRQDTCAVCNNQRVVQVEIMLDDKEHNFCSNPCFSAFKFVSNIVADQCGMCCKYFERKRSESFTIYTERRAKVFCSRICLNVYIIVNRRIVSCQWCKVKKYNFDMIYKQQDAQEILMCSLNCLTLYGVSINAFTRTLAPCDNCRNSATPQYHLTMSDASMRNFCTYQCVMQFQSQFARAPLTLDSEAAAAAAAQTSTAATTTSQTKQQLASGQLASITSGAVQGSGKPFPTGLPKRVKLKGAPTQLKYAGKNIAAVGAAANASGSNSKNKQGIPCAPVITSVCSLANVDSDQTTRIGSVTVRRSRGRGRKISSPPPLVPVSTQKALPAIGRGRPRRTMDFPATPTTATAHSPPRSSGSANTSITTTSSANKRTAGTQSGSTTNAVAVTPSTSKAAAASLVPPPVAVETKIVTVPPMPPAKRNMATSCRPTSVSVGFQCNVPTNDVGTQTGKDYSNKVLIPVPVPIYIPQPMYMYSAPFPVPVPIPLPIPVPVFIPTTRNSAEGIMKEIKKIQDKMPTDPFEAELLMMAEMVAEEKRTNDSDSDDDVNDVHVKPDPGVVDIQYVNNVNEQVDDTHNPYGEDVLQMALKMATGEYDQPAVDLESAMSTSTISNPPNDLVDDGYQYLNNEPQRAGRGRKRGAANAGSPVRQARSPVKRARLQDLDQQAQVPQVPAEKPDANMCLKYTFGVNAWKQWVMTKNADIEKSSAVRRRAFKTELLQMTADELNYSLCLFVKEVRKPNGSEYAPDTIYYLVLGIQQYLYENGRIDNIFTDTFYENFTECLDEVARKFSVLYNDSQYIVTRVEEEHLWECKQLGAHSPHVLLSTLMFFNTKHFNLTTVDEHMQLSFSHIMKHWKRSPHNAKQPGTRNVLLRFYPPQAGLDANPRKKKVYEQQENEENPLRCPVRLYEFYLSKCPESVKTRNDVFYLQPERSCVPDSPVWYSTQALSQEALQKMLHRVKMVKEINIALLTS